MQSLNYSMAFRKPWTEWANYCQDQKNCLGGKYRRRLMRNSSEEGFHEELQLDNKGNYVYHILMYKN